MTLIKVQKLQKTCLKQNLHESPSQFNVSALSHDNKDFLKYQMMQNKQQKKSIRK